MKTKSALLLLGLSSASGCTTSHVWNDHPAGDSIRGSACTAPQPIPARSFAFNR